MTMFHKSKLKEYDGDFPHDTEGQVPVHVDCWRNMKFDHADQDPNEEGISADEKVRRMEYLDTVWWPQVLARVQSEHERLTDEHGESFMQQWDRIVNKPADLQHGFEPG
jgi:hypothetical protein